jgi:hypothetical protein
MKAQARPSGIIVAMVLIAFVVVLGVFATTSFGKQTWEKMKPYLGIKQPEPPLDGKSPVLGYNIQEDRVQYFDDGSQSWKEFQNDGKIKEGKKEVIYGDALGNFWQYYYNRDLPKNFEWEKNSPSGATNRQSYVKTLGFSITDFKKEEKGSALVESYYASGSGREKALLRVTPENKIEEKRFNALRRVGQIEEGFSTYYDPDNRGVLSRAYLIETESLQTLRLKYSFDDETEKYIEELNSVPFPVRAWNLLQKNNLQEALIEEGIVSEIEVSGYPDLFTLRAIESEENKAKYQFYLNGNKPLGIFLTLERVDSILSSPYISTIIEAKTTETNYAPIIADVAEQEIISKVSAWRDEVYQDPIEIKYFHVPSENEREEKTETFCAKFVRGRIVVDLSEPETNCQS